MLDEFKKFALRGNLIELAVAVILGLAFNAVVQSLVDDILLN
jgi:large conductance mechanosensitive channel